MDDDGERKFDGSGYDKDLVEHLERDIVQRNPNVHWSVSGMTLWCDCRAGIFRLNNVKNWNVLFAVMKEGWKFCAQCRCQFARTDNRCSYSFKKLNIDHICCDRPCKTSTSLCTRTGTTLPTYTRRSGSCKRPLCCRLSCPTSSKAFDVRGRSVRVHSRYCVVRKSCYENSSLFTE